MHKPVMLKEVIKLLNLNPNGIYVDGTVGCGGHASQIYSSLSDLGKLICIDIDSSSLDVLYNRATKGFVSCIKTHHDFVNTDRFRTRDRVHYGKYAVLFGNAFFVNDNFFNITNILNNVGVKKINGALLDLGISSLQLDDRNRGFSYSLDGPLDMRMNEDSPFAAYDVVNTYDEPELTRIFFNYGEEKFSKNVARNIIKYRKNSPINSTFKLVEIIKKSIPTKLWFDIKHPAKRVFQAIRIEVNRELCGLENAIEDFLSHLDIGGRMLILTFHSLEDRIVKRTFAKKSIGCTCPGWFPTCTCNNGSQFLIITKKPITPTREEVLNNGRSRSAKLRVIERIA
ncbi:MAG: 16S rRNA (cytosine(1402)-N(4))-methyltransferase RsmH [Clostridiales bacterium]|jgi:16S rRNA (cytosine1402-N4)-methyltransferase|nr:16S rRNA (cytosine(1402)-N(4))-methyltransferase RsmH [Clostridiales bacterium]